MTIPELILLATTIWGWTTVVWLARLHLRTRSCLRSAMRRTRWMLDTTLCIVHSDGAVRGSTIAELYVRSPLDHCWHDVETISLFTFDPDAGAERRAGAERLRQAVNGDTE